MTAAFIERSRISKVIYEIAGDRLKISGWRGLHMMNLELDLRDISSEIQRLRRRFYRVILVTGVSGMVAAGVAIALLAQQVVPFGAVVYLAALVGIVAAALLSTCFRWIRPLEVVRFRSTLGVAVFDITKEKSYAGEFEDFVAALREAIRRSKEFAPRGPARAGAPPARPHLRRDWRWQGAILLGATAAGLPWLKSFAHLSGNLTLGIVFLCSVGGLALCVYSFLSKEHRKFFSLAGAVLALIPIFFY